MDEDEWIEAMLVAAWQHAVAEGDTRRGFDDWRKLESSEREEGL